MDKLRSKKGYICDMDGVIYHGNLLLDGAAQFVHWLEENQKKYIFLTNSSDVPRANCRKSSGVWVYTWARNIFTPARWPRPRFSKASVLPVPLMSSAKRAWVGALYNAGFSMNDVNPDYVVVGETSSFSYEKILKAVKLVRGGAKPVGTNPGYHRPIENGIAPATRALISPIEMTCGKQAYFVGKPNPLMMRHAQKRLGVKPEDMAIIGDRMDTDVIAGIESEMDTVLVLSGVTTPEIMNSYPYRPTYVLNGVGDIPD